jgi:hypothetical protein
MDKNLKQRNWALLGILLTMSLLFYAIAFVKISATPN